MDNSKRQEFGEETSHVSLVFVLPIPTTQPVSDNQEILS